MMLLCSAKYRWLNGQHLRLLPNEQVATMFREQWVKAGILTESASSPFVDVSAYTPLLIG